jgi:hypothetical protein
MKTNKPLDIKMVRMIEVKYERFGDGLPERIVKQYWTTNGQLVGELDPFEAIRDLALSAATIDETS